MASLYETLRSLEVKTFDGQVFIPQNSLEQTLTEETIKRFLSHKQFHKAFYKLEELLKVIMEDGKKTLATCILIHRPLGILRFLEMDRLQNWDSKLPLSAQAAERILKDTADAEAFSNMQWIFLVPFLDKEKSHRVFESEVILPFLKSEPFAKGAFSIVEKVTLFPSYQRLVHTDRGGEVCLYGLLDGYIN